MGRAEAVRHYIGARPAPVIERIWVYLPRPGRALRAVELEGFLVAVVIGEAIGPLLSLWAKALILAIRHIARRAGGYE